MTVLNLNNPS